MSFIITNKHVAIQRILALVLVFFAFVYSTAQADKSYCAYESQVITELYKMKSQGVTEYDAISKLQEFAEKNNVNPTPAQIRRLVDSTTVVYDPADISERTLQWLSGEKCREVFGEALVPSVGTVKNKNNDLEWMACSLGQTWTGITCEGFAQKFTWLQAMDITKGFNYSGYSDWRLPTRMELDSIVYCSKGRRDYDGKCLGKNYQIPTINKQLFPNTAARRYWSSTPNLDDSFYMWVITFDSGSNNNGGGKIYYSYVRLVRNR